MITFPKLHSNLGLYGEFQVSIVEGDKVVKTYPKQKNLILDSGLNMLFTGPVSLANAMRYCAAGDGDEPVVYSSGAVTASVSGTTCTASGSIFTSDMVGMLINFSGGIQRYIDSYSSGTSVTLSASASVSSETFAVWAVNQTTLENEVKRTGTMVSGLCGTLDSTIPFNGLRLLYRTWDFTEEVSNQDYEELGWSNSGTGGATLFSRAVLSGGPVTVMAGQKLRVTYNLGILVSSQSASQTPTITGWPVSPASSTAGNWRMNFYGFNAGSPLYGIGLSAIASNGDTAPEAWLLEPAAGTGPGAATPKLYLATGNALPAFGANYAHFDYSGAALTPGSYSSGTFTRNYTAQWGSGQGNGATWMGISLGADALLGGFSSAYTFIFNQQQTKASGNTLSLTISRSVSRNLVNP